MKPFVLQAANQFRAPIPPPIDSAEYAAAYEEVKSLGGDGIVTPSLCAPPRLYNKITMHIADQMGTSADPVQLARLLAW